MALIELAKVIADDPAASRRWAAEPLPLTDRLTAVLTSRFAALPGQARAALLLAAVADGPDLRVAASHGAGPDARALAPAEQLGLVKVDRTGLQFSHPLVRSAIYHSAPFAQRAAAHRQLAEALHDQPDRRAWHLAAAALQPDEHVASLLEATADQAQRRGGAAAAALAMERAAELSPDPARPGTQAGSRRFGRRSHRPGGLGAGARPPRPGGHSGPGTAAGRPPRRRVGAGLVGRRTAALAALISVAEEASRDLPALAWDALGSAATVAYQSGMPASRQAVSRALGLLERQGPPPPGRAPGIDVNVLRLWIRVSADPIGSRNQLLPYLRKIVGSPIEEPSLWRVASAAWLLDESDLAITLLQDAMQRLRAPGVQGTSGGSLTVLGWVYIDTGRWDEALEVAAEAAGLAEANQMELVAASADVIAATVLAMRADSGAARGMRPGRSPPSIRPNAGWWPPGPGVPSASPLSPTAATSKRSPSSAGCSARTARRCTTTPPTWVWPISPPPRSAPTGGWKDTTSSSARSAASTGRPLPGSSSSSPAPAASSPARTGPKPISARRSQTPPGTSGPSSGPSFASTTPNGCGGAAGSTTPSPS